MDAYISLMRVKKSEILLIEDDIALGASIVEVLQLNDFNVQWLEDGLKALEYLQKNMPDIIISDLMMPAMNGEQLFINIRKL